MNFQPELAEKVTGREGQDPCPDSDVEADDDFWIDDRPIIGYCSVCGEAREDDRVGAR